MIHLEEEELIGLQVMALFNMGVLGAKGGRSLSCKWCKEQSRLNCEMDDSKTEAVFSIDEFGDDYILTSCPLNYVPETILDFIEKYYYEENNNTVVDSYYDCGARESTAKTIYRSYINTLIKMPPEKKPKSQGLGLGKLKKQLSR